MENGAGWKQVAVKGGRETIGLSKGTQTAFMSKEPQRHSEEAPGLHAHIREDKRNYTNLTLIPNNFVVLDTI